MPRNDYTTTFPSPLIADYAFSLFKFGAWNRYLKAKLRFPKFYACFYAKFMHVEFLPHYGGVFAENSLLFAN
jgi:hypothetical protein